MILQSQTSLVEDSLKFHPFQKKNNSHFSDLKNGAEKTTKRTLRVINWMVSEWKMGLIQFQYFGLFWSIFASWWFHFFFFTPYLGKIPILTNIFQRGWFNQQPVCGTTNFGPPDCPFKRCKCTTSPTQTDQKISQRRPWWWFCCVAKAVVGSCGRFQK